MSEKSYSYIFFDLDGTLTDSGPGIMNGFEYAIKQMGDEVGDRSTFRRFIGPPLLYSFETLLGYSHEDAERAVVYYRDYYFNMGGVLENSVYPGIKELLSDLKAAGKKLIVATSKLDHPTKIVLDHFGLADFIDFVSATNDADRKSKTDVIKYALEQCGVADKSEAIMIGDRFHDIEAAVEVGLDSIGVLWGYGDEEELSGAGATYIAASTEDVYNIIMK